MVAYPRFAWVTLVLAIVAGRPSSRAPWRAGGTAPELSSPQAGAPVASASPTPPRTFACGASDQPQCPMQAWMKTTMAPAALQKDAPRLAAALDYVVAHAPNGYDGWIEIAGPAADKARAGDVEGARASCRTCHDRFKQRYRSERRDAPF